MASAGHRVPEISLDELTRFHETHFSQSAADHFDSHFIRPDRGRDQRASNHHTNQEEQPPEHHYDDDDDGLGYYEDGTKRTLTDEQIAMFRHSELEAVRRAQDRSGSHRRSTIPTSEKNITHNTTNGETDEVPPRSESRVPFHKANSQHHGKSRKAKGREQAEPDRRKRTWDVVELGLESLDYD